MKNIFNAIKHNFWCGEIYSHDLNDKGSRVVFSKYQDGRKDDTDHIVMSLYDADVLHEIAISYESLLTKKKNRIEISMCGLSSICVETNDTYTYYTDVNECAKAVCHQITTFLVDEFHNHHNIKVERI